MKGHMEMGKDSRTLEKLWSMHEIRSVQLAIISLVTWAKQHISYISLCHFIVETYKPCYNVYIQNKNNCLLIEANIRPETFCT